MIEMAYVNLKRKGRPQHELTEPIEGQKRKHGVLGVQSVERKDEQRGIPPRIVSSHQRDRKEKKGVERESWKNRQTEEKKMSPEAFNGGASYGACEGWREKVVYACHSGSFQKKSGELGGREKTKGQD